MKPSSSRCFLTHAGSCHPPKGGSCACLDGCQYRQLCDDILRAAVTRIQKPFVLRRITNMPDTCVYAGPPLMCSICWYWPLTAQHPAPTKSRRGA
eukprot:6697197-Prymnesium_polylepis.1